MMQPSKRAKKYRKTRRRKSLNINVQRLAVLNERGVKGFLLVTNVDVLEGEIRQAVLVTLTHVEEVLRRHLDITDGNIVTL